VKLAKIPQKLQLYSDTERQKERRETRERSKRRGEGEIITLRDRKETDLFFTQPDKKQL